MPDPLTQTLLPNTTLLYLLTLALLSLYWLGRVWRAARQRQEARVAWWALPGLALLLLAATQELPALFGVGAGLLLLAEFWPGAYRAAARRPGMSWPLLGLVLGLSLTLGRSPGATLTALGLGLTLAGLAGAGAWLLWPRAPRPVRNTFDTRWSRFSVPEWPELSVTLTGSGVQLRNISARDLNLAGWSPASINGWMKVRDEEGRVLVTLKQGHEAFLPLESDEWGVRVWYTPKDAAQGSLPLLFRADWVPASYSGPRVLN